MTERDELMLAHIESDDRVFEVNFGSIEPTDVTLRFWRDGERVGSIYNDDGTDRTMARLTTRQRGLFAAIVPTSGHSQSNMLDKI